MAAIFPVYSSIKNKLLEALDLVSAGFVDGYVMEGDDAPMFEQPDNIPFVTLEMGDALEHFRGKGICGPVNDLEQLDFLVICSAGTNYHMIGLVDIVSDALVGFRPTEDCGLVRRVGGTINSPVGALLHPIRYNKGVSFVVPIGATMLH